MFEKTSVAFALDSDVMPVLECYRCIELFQLPVDIAFALGYCLRQGLLPAAIALEHCLCNLLVPLLIPLSLSPAVPFCRHSSSMLPCMHIVSASTDMYIVDTRYRHLISICCLKITFLTGSYCAYIYSLYFKSRQKMWW